jgi:hypothetical protein
MDEKTSELNKNQVEKSGSKMPLKSAQLPSKRERFEALWPARIDKASAAIRRLGNLSTSAYDWQPNEISEALRRLSREISEVSDRFRRSRRWPKK